MKEFKDWTWKQKIDYLNKSLSNFEKEKDYELFLELMNQLKER